MEIVNTKIPITSARNSAYIDLLVKTYPFLRKRIVGYTAFQRPIPAITMGTGERKVLFTAAHHANEWITAPVLLKYAQDLADAAQSGGMFSGTDARTLLENVTITLVPLVNPDGTDLVTGAIGPGNIQYEMAKAIGKNYPAIPFPDGWKANLLGVDLNLNYPAGWQQAKKIKFAQGYISPAPRDYVGSAPLDQMETAALAGFTRGLDPDLVIALHTQGQVIYWQFRDIPVPGAKELGEEMARVSGYELAEVPYASSFAGYKDWFIQEFIRPGYTIEVGLGQNPLPLSQFDEIYEANKKSLTVAALGGAIDDGST